MKKNNTNLNPKLDSKNLLNNPNPKTLRKVCHGGSNKKIGFSWTQFSDTTNPDIDNVLSFIGDIYSSIQDHVQSTDNTTIKTNCDQSEIISNGLDLAENEIVGGFKQKPYTNISIYASDINFDRNYIYPLSAPVVGMMDSYIDSGVNIKQNLQILKKIFSADTVKTTSKNKITLKAANFWPGFTESLGKQ
ncbi:hypothetical protein BB561_001976 [Smittium simulii]|uniref:Uncharacterized protein n=1 Tax=Smittium simulii TaxID=133385 RepID=A0A2T9YS61_9FUNG|nr:hypothetical protein BB561_001976 [Smittium simulii]